MTSLGLPSLRPLSPTRPPSRGAGRPRRGCGSATRRASGRPASRSTPTSSPFRFTARPATNTESTFEVSAKTTIVPIGSSIGAVLIASVLRRTMSACFPTEREPTLSSRPQARAPSIVANSSTSRCVSVGANASSGVSVKQPIRSWTSAVRICVNISPGHARDDVDAERRADAAGEQLAGRRRPMAHQHLDVGRDRRLAARLRDPVELLVGQVGHVDVADVRAHQPEVVHVLHGLVVQVVEPHPDVHADQDPELTRERPVVLRHVEVRVAGLARRHREREQAVVGGEVRLADAADVLRVLELAERPPLAAGRHAVRVDGADPGVLQALDRGVGVVRACC